MCTLTDMMVDAFSEHQCAKFTKKQCETEHSCFDCAFCRKEENRYYCSATDQSAYFAGLALRCKLFEKKMKKVSIPCYVSVKRFYKCWMEVNEDATAEEIKKALKDAIVEDPEGMLSDEDPDIETEEQDIDVLKIDWDGVQDCDDEESEEK